MALNDTELAHALELACSSSPEHIGQAYDNIQRALWYMVRAERAIKGEHAAINARVAAAFTELNAIATVLESAAGYFEIYDEAYSE